MGAVLLLLVQAVAATPPERIDLLHTVVPAGCKDPEGAEIVVCGRTGLYRLQPPEPRPDRSSIPKAEPGLDGKETRALETEAAAIPNGTWSNRLMARAKVPLP